MAPHRHLHWLGPALHANIRVDTEFPLVKLNRGKLFHPPLEDAEDLDDDDFSPKQDDNGDKIMSVGVIGAMEYSAETEA